jgi:hypothetical protein
VIFLLECAFFDFSRFTGKNGKVVFQLKSCLGKWQDKHGVKLFFSNPGFEQGK